MDNVDRHSFHGVAKMTGWFLEFLDFLEIVIWNIEYCESYEDTEYRRYKSIASKEIYIYSIQEMPDATPNEHKADHYQYVFGKVSKKL